MNLRLKALNLKLQRKISAFLLVVFMFGIVVQVASAQTRTVTPTPLQVPENAQQPTEGIALTLSPTYLTLSTDPGENVSSQFKVTNNNNFTEYLEVNVMKIGTGADGSTVYQDITEADEFANWLSLSEEQFSLSPNQAKTINFSISPPENANLGYYYALLVSRMGVKSGEETGAVISGAAALPVLLEVRSPNAKRELQVVDFKTDKLFYEYLPTTFKVEVKNSGNVHIVPFGDIFIDSMTNKEIAVLPVNRGFGNVLPNVSRVFDVVWDDAFAVRVPKTEDGKPVVDESGNPKLSTRYDFKNADKFRIGKYTASMILVYDNGERDIPIEAQVSFWVIPWKILIAGFIILVLALLGLRSALAPMWRKIRRK